MSACQVKAWLISAVSIALLFFTGNCYAQLTIGTVDPGPYTRGSTITAGFTINSTSCININNRFELYLSNASGNFGSEQLIGTYNGFYGTFVNGVIPAGTPAGTGYRLRVKSTLPALTSTVSAPFEIKAGAAIETKLTSTLLNAANEEVFGSCLGKANNEIDIGNESTAGGIVTAVITDELNGGTAASLTFNTTYKTFEAQLAHYTVLAKNIMPDGTVATKSYLIVNNSAVTAFATSGNNIVCLPLGFLEFSVDITSEQGIKNNFPGDIYVINWGDETTEYYTLCSIRAALGKVRHIYTESSCGNVSSGTAGTIYNVFDVSINVSNAFCGSIGTAVSSTAKVVVKPVNEFTFSPFACTNSQVTFVNTSIQGENPNTNTDECTPNQIVYRWFVDGVLVQPNKPITYNLVYTFLTHGNHVVRLESANPGACDADPFEVTICVQDPPEPSFTLPVTKGCGPLIIKPVNTSYVDLTCSSDVTYNWLVIPSTNVTYVNGTTVNSPVPEIRIPDPGQYTIRLVIGTPTCGVKVSEDQTVIVNNARTVQLSPAATLCNLATYDFSATTTGPTKTVYSGSEVVLDDVYEWTVTGGAASFEGGTTAASKYPSIKFDEYKTYTVTVKVTNVCGESSSSQQITFIPAPGVSAGNDQPICYTATAQLDGSVSGSTGVIQSLTWVGGAGSFSPDRNALNAVYTPTTAERNARQVILTLTATTSLGSPCNVIEDEVVISIRPENAITSAAAKSICSGTDVNYKPQSGVAGSVYTWTATNPDGRASGFSNGSGPTITDVITNSDNSVSATVIYTITAAADGCTGPAFTFTVTIDPTPVITATPANATICSNNGAGIALASSVTGTSYTWTSIASGGITGNDLNQNTPASITAINETLINNGTTQGTVTYTITPVTNSGCPGDPVVAVVNVDPKVPQANAGPDESVCGTTSYALKGNTPAFGTGQWALVSGPGPVIFADPSDPATTVSGLVIGQVYTFRWRISAAGACAPTADNVKVTVNFPTVGGTTTGSNSVCSGTNTGTITLSGQTGNIIRWERSADNGTNWMPVANTTNSIAYNNLTTTTQYRALVQNANCSQEFSSVSEITVNEGGTTANAGNPQILCNGQAVTLDGNLPAPGETGLWADVNASSALITNPADPKTTVTNLVPGNNYTFKWTITSTSPCGPTSANVQITDLAPLSNTISTTTTEVCSGQLITITGSTPTGGSGIFTYLWEISANGVNWSTVNAETGQDLNYTISSTLSFRRTVFSSACSLVSNVINIVAQPPLANNSISATQDVCANLVPAPLTGSIPAGADGNYSYQWQSGPDGTIWANINGETNQNYAPPVLAATTFYRRIVSSAACSGPLQSISNAVKLTLLPNARAEYAFTTDNACAPFALNSTNIVAVAYPDRNSSYEWFANGQSIGPGVNFPGYTITGAGQTVTIKLVATSSLGCSQAEFSHDFTSVTGFTTAFTQDGTTGCGPLTVRFTNTSSSLTDAAFKWDFGNGTTSSLATPPDVMFLPDPSGDDITYTVTLTAATSCGDQVATSTVLVRSAPVVAFSPDKTVGCSPLAVNFSNTSKGNDLSFTYDFGDGSAPLTTTSTANVAHTYTVTEVTDFTVTMTATNSCGTDFNTYLIRVSPNTILPELVVPGDQKTGCAPFTVSFTNNTKGANAFVYDFGDGSSIQTTTAPETIQHTFTRGGTFNVVLYATNGCSNATTTETIVVQDQPVVAFSADKTTGCPGLSVKFTNNSVNGLTYVWDFGDGTTSAEFEPEHVFTASGPYNISLTAINSMGCPNTATLPNYINVVPLPEAIFSVAPGNEITIPNYRFTFSDISTGNPTSWNWDFGDGATSTLQNPSHLYNKTGDYAVTLTVTNKEGCTATSFQSIKIIDVPGALNLPNSFMPGSQNNEIRLFKAKGMGIASYKLTIFNKWGQVLWESTLLENGAPAEGWDGTSTNESQPQGTYFWKAEVKFINGSEWKGVTYDSSSPKRTGEIYLIR